MKKYIYMAVAAIAALSSCGSDNDSIMGEADKQPLVFTGTMEGAAARATFENNRAKWEEGDKISINGVNYKAKEAELTTTFKAVTDGEEAEGPTYNAYFACTYDGTTATLPAAVSETWADGQFNMPMYATSTTTDLAFKNLCGVLKITVKNDQIAAVKKIKVSSANMAVSGAFTVTSDAAVLTNATTVANTLTVTYTDAVTTTAEGKVFYVAVPAQDYRRLKISLSADGNGFTKSMITKSDADITVERNKIYPITFAHNAQPTTGSASRIGGTVNWVQLWENGPKFAEYNVGAESASEYGGHYAWGGSTNERTSDRNLNQEDLTGDSDTATKLWGSNWRMPTKAEYDALVANCTCEWTTFNGMKGYLVKGKNDYSSNSVFFPAAGVVMVHGMGPEMGPGMGPEGPEEPGMGPEEPEGPEMPEHVDARWEQQDEFGNYWSSNPAVDYAGHQAWYLSFADWKFEPYATQVNSEETFSVRAVLAE